MSYVIPSVLVYQILENSSSSTTDSPDLDAILIGPCTNVVDYDPTSSTSLINTAAVSATATTATAEAGSYVFTVAAPGEFSVNDTVLISGAGSSAAILSTTIKSISGNAITTADACITAVTDAVFTKPGTLTNPNTVNSYQLPSQCAGQIPDAASVSVYFSTVDVRSWSGHVTPSSEASVLTFDTADSNINSTTSTLKVEVGDVLTLTDGESITFKSVIRAVTTSSGLNGNLATVTIVDSIPTDFSGSTIASVTKTYTHQLLGSEYVDTAELADNIVSIKVAPALNYGTIVSGVVHVAYVALRTDLSSAVQDIDSNTREGIIGVDDYRNPLSLAARIALSNTTTTVKVLAVSSDDSAGYQEALDLIEDLRVYALVPLTQDQDIIGMFKSHCTGMSTAVNAGWRVCIANTEIPTTKTIGDADDVTPNTDAENAITISGVKRILTAPNATFLTDGVAVGDYVQVVKGSAFKITTVINNQQVQLESTAAAATGVEFYVYRKLTKDQQASSVASVSTTWASNRVVHVQPDICGVSVGGVTKRLPGFYLCAAVAGLIAGLPVQQGLTNISVADIVDIKHSNFYFSRTQMNTMAAAGTFLFTQETQDSAPYVRHELTTDVSVLEYKELQKVKNWDYLSYLTHDKIKSFLGTWNITDDTLKTLRQSLVATYEWAKSQKVAKVGAPLTSYSITTLEQNANNADTVDVVVSIKMPSTLNYVNIYLTV